MIKNIIKALRLPFVGASILPFIFGSFICRQNFNLTGFFSGLIAVFSTHLSANLINDYFDSKSGADWQDKNLYKYFGGSKLIQQYVFTEKFYLRLAIIFAIASLLSVVVLSLTLKSFFAISVYIIILLLGWLYSANPIAFAYRGFGEVIIFLLFGPALVMGGYFIQTKIFPDVKSFLLSLPFGLFTAAILFANEVPDFNDDKKVGKNTWAVMIGSRNSFLLYVLLECLAFLAIGVNIMAGFLRYWAVFIFIFLIPAYRAAKIIKNCYNSKFSLLQSSKLTIIVQACVSICLILVLFLN